MTWIGQLRAARISHPVRERVAAYSEVPENASRERVQLSLLNAEWARAIRSSPYFRSLADAHSLPGSFESLEQFVESVPPMDRSTLQREGDSLVCSGRDVDFHRITGGSTAEPIQVPAWSEELRYTAPDCWAARSWYSVGPASRLFLLWGHSHLLGTGVRGWFNARKRELQDKLLGYRRFSAYDLGEDNLREAAREMIRFRPDYLVGYSVALHLFARAAAPFRHELRSLGLRVVVGAAEAFPEPDSAERIADLFGCAVGMEYGSVETNLIAHTHPEGGYRVFWKSYLVEADDVAGRYPIRVTSLYPRAVPLIRYALGDEIEPWEAGGRLVSIASFKSVVGRCNDFVTWRDGTTLHSEVFTHAVRPCATIRSYQVVQTNDSIELHVIAERDLAPGEREGIRSRLAKVHADLSEIEIVNVRALQQTIAGKTPMIVRRRS